MATRLGSWSLSLLLVAGVASAEPSDKEFKARFAALKAKAVTHFAIKMNPGDDPAALPKDASAGGLVLVAGGRSGIYTPPILSGADFAAVIKERMVDVRTCYKKQLAADPDWADDLILDLSVRKTGTVAEVNVAPRRVRNDVIGQCMMAEVPKWKFPEFTGEIDEGIVQDTVNASFPFSFSGG